MKEIIKSLIKHPFRYMGVLDIISVWGTIIIFFAAIIYLFLYLSGIL